LIALESEVVGAGEEEEGRGYMAPKEEAGEDERQLKDPPGSSDKEGELRSVLDGLSFPISVPHKLVCIFSFSIFLSFCCMEMFIYVGFAPGSESVVSRFLSWILFMGSLD